MEIVLTSHARIRLLERGIAEDQIRAALSAPHRFLKEAIPGRRKIVAKLPAGDLVVVYVYAPGDKPKLIVSAWWMNDA